MYVTINVHLKTNIKHVPTNSTYSNIFIIEFEYQQKIIYFKFLSYYSLIN